MGLEISESVQFIRHKPKIMYKMFPHFLCRVSGDGENGEGREFGIDLTIYTAKSLT